MRLWRFRMNILWLLGIMAVLHSAGCIEPEPIVPSPAHQAWMNRGVYKPPKLPPIEFPPYKPPGSQNQATTYIGPRKIVIDPGHGGKDPGARGRSSYPEKTLVLAIAKELNTALKVRGAVTVMTRSSDRFIELSERAAIAERSKAELFVSIHADYTSKSSIKGATVLIGRTASKRSKRAATAIKNALKRAGITTRAIRPQNLRVLEGHSRPAVLIECGFLSNGTEAINLNTSTYQHKLAQAIADGIADYF